MDETPAEREQRLARIKEMSLVDRQLKRARTTELKRQSDEVRRLAQEQDWLTQSAVILENIQATLENIQEASEADLEEEGLRADLEGEERLPGLLGDISEELPATGEARSELIRAMRRYAGELGVEMRTRWID
jgi:hypothetical protein